MKYIIGLGISLVAIVVLCVVIITSAGNTAVGHESAIIAAHDNSRNVLGQHAPKIAEAMGVAEVQADALEDLFTGANAARYGADGAKADRLFITEQNPNLDQSTYARILGMIEAGRSDFAREQTAKLDRIRAYRVASQTQPSKFLMGLAGYPTAGFFDKYDMIVTSQHAADAFETGIDNGVKIK